MLRPVLIPGPTIRDFLPIVLNIASLTVFVTEGTTEEITEPSI
jgi:hypothetical protein